MSDIDKTIERVKRSDAEKKFSVMGVMEHTVLCQDSIMPIIAELETANKRIAELENTVGELGKIVNELHRSNR